MLPTLTLKKKAMVYLSLFQYVTDLAADMEGSSSDIIIRCVVISSTSHRYTSPLTVYVENP